MNTFVHLHVHSEYSLANSVVRIADLVSQAAALRMPALAVTDQANIYGLVKFYRAAVDRGLKPIVGTDVFVANEHHPTAPTRLVLLARNEAGYKSICALLTRAYREGQKSAQPCLHRSWFRECGEGLIVLSGAEEGELGQALLTANRNRALDLADQYAELFPNCFYVEMRRLGSRNEEQYIDLAFDLAAHRGLPVVATNGVHFLRPDEFDNHEVRVCIHEGRVLGDKRRPRRFTRHQYLRSAEEMCELFADLPEALENTVEIAKRCNFTLQMGDAYLPDFPVPEGSTVDAYLREQSLSGLDQRLATTARDNQDQQPYRERLQLELDVISQMGFPGYFLIVADFIAWAKQNAIPVGPGRGSGAGSLVAWALGITELDPIAHGLLFERFLNPERVSLPDFDIDFCIEGRDRVIDYVAHSYGRSRVSQIITYGTMAARAVVRDVGRVMGMGYGQVDKIAKLIPFEVGMTLAKALEQEQLLAQSYADDEDIRQLLDTARALEGLARNVGKHAGGVVIAPADLNEFTALYCEPGSEQIVTHFDKDDLEAIGLVKFDFLGLRTLTIIDRALRKINEQRAAGGEAPIELAALPMDDTSTFELLKSCRTTALFQLESRGMKDLIHRLQPDRFEDLVALVALFRPGPLQSGMVDDFIDRKHGRAKLAYPHPSLEPILRPTYGVILYQEQVMEIARVLAGYSLGSADLLRRAMGKKKAEAMARQREVFQDGASERGVDPKTAAYIFDLMEKFAGYGFNKSHSAAYALITYQTAWLKAHYPAQFMAAALSADMEHTDKVVTLIADCREMDLEVLNPDVNRCGYAFEAAAEGAILYGLGAIKGVGSGVIDAIVEARRTGGVFKDLFDLLLRIDSKRVNRRALESLIQAGALDGLGSHRASLAATLPTALDLAGQQERSAGQDDLFGVEETVKRVCVYREVPPYTQEQILSAEKDTLGLYLSGHPIDAYRQELDALVDGRLADLNPDKDRSVIVAGLVVGLRILNTKRGERMAFVTLDDHTARLELAVFSELFIAHRDILHKDTLVVVQGQVSVDEFTGGFRMSAESIFDIDQARRAFVERLVLRLGDNAGRVMAPLGELLNAAPGPCPVYLDMETAGARGVLQSGNAVSPTKPLVDGLRELLGADAVCLAYGRVARKDSAEVNNAA